MHKNITQNLKVFPQGNLLKSMWTCSLESAHAICELLLASDWNKNAEMECKILFMRSHKQVHTQYQSLGLHSTTTIIWTFSSIF